MPLLLLTKLIFLMQWLNNGSNPPQLVAHILLLHLVGLNAVLTIKPYRSKPYLAHS